MSLSGGWGDQGKGEWLAGGAGFAEGAVVIAGGIGALE